MNKRIIAFILLFILLLTHTATAYASSLGNKINSGVNTIKDGAKDVSNTIDKATSDLTNKVKEKTPTVKDTFNNAKDSASKTVVDAKNTASEKASQAVDGVTSAANVAGEKVQEIASQIELPDFKKGWTYASKLYTSKVASQQSAAYVNDVQKAIQHLQTDINSNAKISRGIAQEAGFAAEKWHADTFNIDSVASGSKKAATTLESNGRGSVDVSIAGEKNASLKYYKNAEGSAKAQAENIVQKYNEYCATARRHGNEDIPSLNEYVKGIDYDVTPELYWSMYQDQVRVIPSDQLDDAQKYLEKLIAKEQSKPGKNRAKLAEGYEETLRNLTDKLEASDGTKSIPLTKEEAEAIAKASQEGDFKPSDFGVTASSVIKPQYIIKQSMAAGTQAAALNVAIVTGPEIYQIIKKLIDDGELDEEQLKTAGFDALSAGGEGFLEGSISSALLVACASGKFGAAFKNASPDVIGTLTVIAIEAAKYGYQMSKGQITAEQYADNMAEDIFIAAASLGTGALVQFMFPMLPGAYFAGSMAGSLLASAGYETGRDVVLAIKNEGGIDTVAIVTDKSTLVANKVVTAQTNLSEALSNLNIKPKKDFKIKLYNLASSQ